MEEIGLALLCSKLAYHLEGFCLENTGGDYAHLSMAAICTTSSPVWYLAKESSSTSSSWVLAIRGSYSRQDWLMNFDWRVTEGGLHLAYFKAAEQIYETLHRKEKAGEGLTLYDPGLVQEFTEKREKLLITGHSLGGSIALILQKEFFGGKEGGGGVGQGNIDSALAISPVPCFTRWDFTIPNALCIFHEQDPLLWWVFDSKKSWWQRWKTPLTLPKDCVRTLKEPEGEGKEGPKKNFSWTAHHSLEDQFQALNRCVWSAPNNATVNTPSTPNGSMEPA